MCDDLDDAEAFETDEHTYSVECEGDPKPVCKWTKDGKAIDTADGRIAIAENNGVYTLTIKNIKMDDKGKYQAEFSNRAGDKVVTSNLNILCKQAAYIL